MYFVFFSFQPKSPTIFWTSSFWELFLLKLSYLTWQARGCFCHIFEDWGGGPRGCGKGEVKPCTKVLSCVGWHWDREVGTSLKGRLYETPPSVSPPVIIYFSVSLHFDAVMGCPRDMKPSGSGQCSPCWQFWLLPSISWMASAAWWSWQQLFLCAPPFLSPPPLLYLLRLWLSSRLRSIPD